MKSEFVCPSLYSCCVHARVWRRERARGEREGGVESGESERGKRQREWEGVQKCHQSRADDLRISGKEISRKFYTCGHPWAAFADRSRSITPKRIMPVSMNVCPCMYMSMHARVPVCVCAYTHARTDRQTHTVDRTTNNDHRVYTHSFGVCEVSDCFLTT